MSTAGEATDLDRAVAGVYGGPLEDFVHRRDALVKALRSAGRREDATLVKGLRKPSRLAWALDLAATPSEDAFATLDAAVAATLDAHATGGDVRGAIAGLRVAVREFAAHAARAAGAAGHRIGEAGLSTAVLAVLGNADAFGALRLGRLAEVPDAGGLDFLSSLPMPPPIVAPPKPKPPEAPAAPAGPSPESVAMERAAREAVADARSAVLRARERSEEAQRVLREAESTLRTGEDRLRQLAAEVHALRAQCERAREASEAAATRLPEAERTLADAETQLERLAGGGSGR